MPIAVAGRISMSLPGVFSPVMYDPDNSGTLRPFMDGGIGSNLPTEVVTHTNPQDRSTKLGKGPSRMC